MSDHDDRRLNILLHSPPADVMFGSAVEDATCDELFAALDARAKTGHKTAWKAIRTGLRKIAEEGGVMPDLPKTIEEHAAQFAARDAEREREHHTWDIASPLGRRAMLKAGYVPRDGNTSMTQIFKKPESMTKPSSSLVPAAPVAPLTAADHKRLGTELTALYHDAIEGNLRVLAFGAKFSEVEKIVSTCGHDRARGGGRDTKGAGMKGWLAQHAPEISRTTAYRFRDIAEGVARHHGIKDPARIFGADTKQLGAPELKKRDKVIAFMCDRSLRSVQLELGLTNPAADVDPSTGKRVHHPIKRSPAELQAEWAKAAKERAATAFSELHSLDDRWKLLDDAHLKVALADAKKLVKDLAAWLETPEPVRVGCEIERHIRAAGPRSQKPEGEQA